MVKEFQPGFELPEVLTGHPMRQICFDIPDVEEYRRAFWGHIYELGAEWKWERTAPADERHVIAAEYWRQILYTNIDRFYSDENCETEDCKSYSPGAPFIQWFPNDPYNTPGLVPDGYNNPPWYLATVASNLALGSSTGDVITSIDRFPPGSLPSIIPASGLPRFRVNVSGEGRITLHLVNLIAGSLIQLTKDDDPFTVKFIDVSRDLVSVPPETMDAFQVEVEFTTPGLHWIDCIVVSWVNASIPFLHHGGGLRQVDLCGFTDMPLVPPTMIRSDPSGCGNLEKSTDGGETWVDIDNTDFLRRDGVCTMTGGLEIYPTADEALLTLKGVGTPYQTAKIMRVQDSAGVDVAWINPRGDAVLSGVSGNRALVLQSGGLGLDNIEAIFWKNNVGTYQKVLYCDTANRLHLKTPGAGIFILNNTGSLLGQWSESGNFVWQNDTPTTGQTSFTVVAGVNQSNLGLHRVRQRDNTEVFGVQSDGRLTEIANDAVTGIVDNLALEHRITGTPIAGFGSGIRLQGKSSTSNAQSMARLYAAWETATHATRAAKVVLSAFDFSGEKTLIEGGVTGASTPKLGFLGATPQPRLAITGDSYGIPALDQVIDALALFGFVTDASAPGTPPWMTALPAPLAVDGSWYGVEAGKNMAVALDETGYIVDQTDLGTPGAQLDLRCRATATIQWVISQIYTKMGIELTFSNATLTQPERFYTALAFSYLTGTDDVQQFDINAEWAEPLYNTFSEDVTPAVTFTEHIVELMAYLPTIEEAFYCSLTDTGALTAAGRTAFLERILATNITDDVPQDIETWWYQFIKWFTANDWSVMIAAGSHSFYADTIDCSLYACGGDVGNWCKRYLFSVSAYAPPFEAITGDHVFGGTLSGWKTDDNGDLRIEFPFPTIDVDLKYTVTVPTAAISVEFGSLDAGYSVNLSTAPGTYNETLTIPEANRADGWYFEAHCNPEVCTVKLKQVDRMTGTGLEPTEGNDCI